MNTRNNRQVGAALAAVLVALLAAAVPSLCAAQTTDTAQPARQASPSTIANCTMSDGLIEKTRTCQHLDPATLELRYTQTCKLTRTIWSDRLELVGCSIERAGAVPAPTPAPRPLFVGPMPQGETQTAQAPAQPCR